MNSSCSVQEFIETWTNSSYLDGERNKKLMATMKRGDEHAHDYSSLFYRSYTAANENDSNMYTPQTRFGGPDVCLRASQSRACAIHPAKFPTDPDRPSRPSLRTCCGIIRVRLTSGALRH